MFGAYVTIHLFGVIRLKAMKSSLSCVDDFYIQFYFGWKCKRYSDENIKTASAFQFVIIIIVTKLLLLYYDDFSDVQSSHYYLSQGGYLFVC